ncbi:SDR family oxidoreductase [Salinisphaera hydrothermalis]|uniref:SDR family oxidoreductase n=1 Tax=Salinisphaera hydrothermalis TaxID=563188 RepID=UPI0033428670
MSAPDKICLVTGAAQGIGRAITRRLLADGHIVWCLDHDQGALDDLAAGVDATQTTQVHTIVADVSCEDDVAAAAQAIKQQHGRLDLVVNNAGIAGPFNGPIDALALADWQRVIDVNLTGFFLVVKHTLPLLRASSQNATIVNMASSRAYQSEPQTEAYAASKGGIHALTHALAVSLGPGIRVNAVAPGWIDVRGEQTGADTPEPLREIDHAQHPTGRVGRGEDIAGIVAFLASADAAFITGQTLVADGGMTRKMIYEH